MFELIRGCHLLYSGGRKIIATAALGAVVTIASFAIAASSAVAADKPPSLVDAVRTAIAEPKTAEKGKGQALPDSITSAPEQVGNKAESSGINLTDAPPLSQADAEKLNLQRQAEETAARAAEEAARMEEEHNRKSYKGASEGLLPLSPDQVRGFMHKLENTQRAAMPPTTGTPRGEVKVVGLSLDPGGEPPQINLAAGYVTTIDIIDQTGEPWPILDVGIGGNFEVTPTQAGSHVVRVVPLTRFGTGNLSILLKDLSTPVIFRLSAGGPTFHMRYDARVPQIGPMARTPLIQYRKGPVAGDAVLSMFLENAPPPDAKRLIVGGVDARTKAWAIADKVYVRTSLSLLSPAWNASVSSSDGMTVYEVGSAPVLLLSDNGAMIRARLIRDDSHDK